MGEGQTLKELFRKEFPKHDPTPAEERLLNEIGTGDVIDLCPSDVDSDCDPGQADTWGPERTMSAAVLGWLCTDREASRFISRKGIQIRGARIVGRLDLESADLPYQMALTNCRCEAEILLRGAHVKELSLSSSHTRSINLEGAKIEGGVFLNEGFKAQGEVGLLGATLGGQLNCSGGELVNPGGNALSADEAKIEGHVFLDEGFKAQGEVRLLGATVGGQLICSGGELVNPGGNALFANGAKIEGGVFLDEGFKARGRISLVSATVEGFFNLRDVAEPEGLSLDLESAAVGTLSDEQDSWPPNGQLWLDGFTCTRIARDAPRDGKSRVRWLRLQPQDEIHPQPYEFLARTLAEAGAIRAARNVGMAKSWDTRKARCRKVGFAPLRWVRRAWDLFLRVAFGYGYRLWATWVALALAFFIAGVVVFDRASSRGIIMQMSPPQTALERVEETSWLTPPRFHPVLYSLDLLLPIPLGFEEQWQSDETQRWGFTVSCFSIGLIVAGWVLAALGTATATGVLQRRI